MSLAIPQSDLNSHQLKCFTLDQTAKQDKQTEVQKLWCKGNQKCCCYKTNSTVGLKEVFTGPTCCECKSQDKSRCIYPGQQKAQTELMQCSYLDKCCCLPDKNNKKPYCCDCQPKVCNNPYPYLKISCATSGLCCRNSIHSKLQQCRPCEQQNWYIWWIILLVLISVAGSVGFLVARGNKNTEKRAHQLQQSSKRIIYIQQDQKPSKK